MTTYINADDGIVSGVAGLKYGADSSGALVLQTNGTTAISISAAQAVTFVGAVSFTTASFTNLSYTGTLTGGTGVVNLGTGQFVKDASGNIGVGVTPNAWRSTNPALQIGQAGGLFGYSSSVITGLASNTFINSAGDEKYIATGTATLYQQNNSGTHRWFTAASGTAGDTVTFSERMRIDSSGNVGILNSAPATALETGTFGTGLAVGSTSATHNITLVSSTTSTLSAFKFGDGGSGVYDQGYMLYDHANNFMALGTNRAERMRIDSSGNVGIGTTAPLSKLDITSSNGTNPNADAASFLRLTNTATGANSTSGVGFYASLSGTQFQTAYIQSVATFNSNADSMLAFGTRSTSGAATERMRILSTGNILSLAGGSTTATGTGIAFPATQDASSFANVLDDYEEGTWTPTDLSGAGLSFSGGVGTYTKIGRMVYFAFDITFPSTASTASISISLPFNPVNWNTGKITAASIGYQNTGTGIVCSTYHGTNSLLFYNISGSATQNSTMSNREIAVSGCYPTS